MAYKISKQSSQKEIENFKFEHWQDSKGTLGYCMGSGENEEYFFALEPDEIMQDGEPVKNPDYEAEQLAKAKTLKLEEINTAKEKAFKEGLIFKGHHFDCDDRAQDRTGNRLLLLQAMPVETLEWLDFDYKPVVLTAVEFQNLCAAIFERVQFIEFKTGQLLGAVKSAQTLEELEAINITFDEVNTDENQPAQGDSNMAQTPEAADV